MIEVKFSQILTIGKTKLKQASYDHILNTNLKRQFIKVESITHIIVGTNSLWVTVHHDSLVSELMNKITHKLNKNFQGFEIMH